jgi:phosphoribosylaminoimidazole-succinocarboxamide synthase
VAAGEAPEMLDKENLRRWLLAQGFSGHGTPPPLSDAIRSDLAAHYWDLTERVLGHRVQPELTSPLALRTAVQAFLKG